MIRCLKSARSRTFLLYTTSLINPHAKKSSGVKSGDLGVQAVGPCHMLINTWQKLENRLDICRATTGAHIEVYWRAYKTFWVTLYNAEKINFTKYLSGEHSVYWGGREWVNGPKSVGIWAWCHAVKWDPMYRSLEIIQTITTPMKKIQTGKIWFHDFPPIHLYKIHWMTPHTNTNPSPPARLTYQSSSLPRVYTEARDFNLLLNVESGSTHKVTRPRKQKICTNEVGLRQ
jgi:hypothetical protein